MGLNYYIFVIIVVMSSAWAFPFVARSDEVTEIQVDQTPVQCGMPVVFPNLTAAARESDYQSRIVGGYVATNHSWPWQAMFVHRRPGQQGLYFHCGGSIVGTGMMGNLALVPFARTMSRRANTGRGANYGPSSYNNLFVIVGDHDMMNPAELHQVESDMDSVYVHPRYNIPTQLNNDYCLMRTKKVIKYNDHVRPICLPTSAEVEPAVGTTCYTSGWGSTSANIQFPVYPPILRQVDVEIMSQQLCKIFYGNVITSSMICATIPGQGSCLGDSGGPLMCQNDETGQWTLDGVTSFVSSAGCGHDLFPTVYARPAAVLDWIKEIMESH